jgi:hypothetical protein
MSYEKTKDIVSSEEPYMTVEWKNRCKSTAVVMVIRKGDLEVVVRKLPMQKMWYRRNRVCKSH